MSDDQAWSDEELRWATKRGGNNKSGGSSNMRVEDLKDWLASAEWEEEAEKEGGKGMRGGGHVALTRQTGPAHLKQWRNPLLDVAHTLC